MSPRPRSAAKIRLLQPEQPAESPDYLEALVTGEDHASAPPIEEDCALDTEIGELERFFHIRDNSGATIDEKFLPAINDGLLPIIDHKKNSINVIQTRLSKKIPTLRMPLLNQQIWNILPTSTILSGVKLQYFQLLMTKTNNGDRTLPSPPQQCPGIWSFGGHRLHPTSGG